MRTGYPPIKKTRAAIAVYLAVCMFVYGFFGFGFYKMFQPLQFPNPGLAAYKPPPATVIIYFPTAKLIYGEPAPSDKTTVSARGRAKSSKNSKANRIKTGER